MNLLLAAATDSIFGLTVGEFLIDMFFIIVFVIVLCFVLRKFGVI